MFYVPVVDVKQKPLMPTTILRAKRWIASKKATPFWKRGIFCVRLNVEPSAVETQEIAVGIDPGSKKEGFTVKAATRDYLNIQADAVTWVKKVMEIRRNMRKGRRLRKTPCRSPRFNRSYGGLPPSTKARWQWKLRIANWLTKMYPISHFVVEDIKAKTMGKKRWDTSFSPLQTGKKWFYEELSKMANVSLKQGYETKEIRDMLGLKKSKNKLALDFSSHCVDSWCLAHSWVGGNLKPANISILGIVPLHFRRRQLHYLQPAKGGIRKRLGGTRSMGLKRGSLVKHKKYGLCYVGGTSCIKGKYNRISLYSLVSGSRLSQQTRTIDCKFLAYNSWRSSCFVNS